MEEEKSPKEAEEGVESEKVLEDEILNLENEIERLRIEYANLLVQQKYMHDARDFLMSSVETIIQEEELNSEDIEAVESESEGTIDSEKSDSDYEAADEKDSSGSDSKEVYHRPNTRSSTQNAIVDSSDESVGIQTRSKTKKSEMNSSDASSKLDKQQEDSDAMLLFSLKNQVKGKQNQSNQSPSAAPASATTSAPVPASENETPISTKPEIPVIPSAAPLLINNPACGEPPKLSDAKKNATKRPLQDMSFLIPSLTCNPMETPSFSFVDTSGNGKLANPRLVPSAMLSKSSAAPMNSAPNVPNMTNMSNIPNVPNMSTLPTMSNLSSAANPAAASSLKQPQSASPASKKPRNQSLYSGAKVSKSAPKVTNTLPRSMVQNVVYNPQAASSLLQPMPSQGLLPTGAMVAGDPLNYPMKPQSTKRGYPGMVDMSTLYPNYTPIQPGLEYPSPMAMPRNSAAVGSVVNPAYGMPPQLFAARQMPVLQGYLPQGMNGRPMEFPAPVYQTPAGYMGQMVTLPNDGKAKMPKVSGGGVAPQGVNPGLVPSMQAMQPVQPVQSVQSVQSVQAMQSMPAMPSVQGGMQQIAPQGARSIYIPAISADEEGNILPNN